MLIQYHVVLHQQQMDVYSLAKKLTIIKISIKRKYIYLFNILTVFVTIIFSILLGDFSALILYLGAGILIGEKKKNY